MTYTERFASATIGIKRLAFAVCTSVGSASTNPTYGSIYLCNGLVNADPETEETPEVQFTGNTRWRYLPSSIEIEKTTLTPEFQSVMLGQTLTSGVLEKRLTDEPPIIAILWETVQANGKRVRWLLPHVRITSAELSDISTKDDSLDFQHFELSGVYWHTLRGVKYRKAYEELSPGQFSNWFTSIQL